MRYYTPNKVYNALHAFINKKIKNQCIILHAWWRLSKWLLIKGEHNVPIQPIIQCHVIVFLS